MSSIYALLGRRIREERKARGFTQQELAGAAGLDTGHLSRIEHGKAVPSINAVGKIADSLSLPISRLFADVPARNPPEQAGWTEKVGAMVKDVPPRRRVKLLRILKTIVKNGP